MSPEMPADKYIKAHIKSCHQCRKHDRYVSEYSTIGTEYTPKELARYAAHIRNTIARIKLAVKDEALGI